MSGLRFPGLAKISSIKKHRLGAAALLLCLLLAACLEQPPQPTLTASPTGQPSPSMSATPSITHTLIPPVTGTATYNPSLPVWQNFAPPSSYPVTPIPPPMTGINLPEEIKIAVLLGTDRPYPFVGRTDAITLLIYHPRFGKASILSIPPDLMVYIPGFTMQRLHTAYALGGMRLFSTTLQYNFGLQPQNWLLVHLDDFGRLVDELGGLEIPVLKEVPEHCGGIPEGTIHMNGEITLCYIRLRFGRAEAERNRRQQEVLGVLLLKMLQGGNLARLPQLYTDYKNNIETNVTLGDVLTYVPLVIKFGDPNRVGFFNFNEEQLVEWEIPGRASAPVFLSRQKAVRSLVQEAIDFVNSPSPLSDVVLTLAAQLTISPTTTVTPTPTRTGLPTRTNTPRPSTTRTVTPTMTLTPTVTVTGTITPNTSTPTGTITPNTSTPTGTITPNTQTPTVTQTSTMTPTP